MIGFIIILGVVAAVVELNIWDSRRSRDGAWQMHGLWMRRWVKDGWQYRQMTEEEIFESENSRAW